MSSEKLVYSDELDASDKAKYREVDQCFTIYEEFEIDDKTGLQLQVNVPIECKFRQDLEYFAFREDGTTLDNPFPIASDMKGSEAFDRALGFHSSCPVFDTFAAISIKEGQCVGSIDKEQLIYKAGAALYDYVAFDVSCMNATLRHDQALHDLGIVEQFKAENKGNGIREWVRKLDPAIIRKFRESVGSAFRMFSAYLPVICVNGPIYQVRSSETLEPIDYEEIPYAVKTIRKAGWPGSSYEFVSCDTPEAAVIVTNVMGLEKTLDIAQGWHKYLKRAMSLVDKDILATWSLEVSLEAAMHSEAREGWTAYRSDLGYL